MFPSGQSHATDYVFLLLLFQLLRTILEVGHKVLVVPSGQGIQGSYPTLKADWCQVLACQLIPGEINSINGQAIRRCEPIKARTNEEAKIKANYECRVAAATTQNLK